MEFGMSYIIHHISEKIGNSLACNQILLTPWPYSDPGSNWSESCYVFNAVTELMSDKCKRHLDAFEDSFILLLNNEKSYWPSIIDRGSFLYHSLHFQTEF